MKYVLDLEYTMTAGIEVEADSAEEAVRKWEDGDCDDRDIEIDDIGYGGIPWRLVDIVECKKEVNNVN